MNEYNLKTNEKLLQESQQYWDHLASTLDNEPDHDLRDPLVRETGTEFLKTWLPQTKATILDMGCGTGSLSIVMPELRYKVTRIDSARFLAFPGFEFFPFPNVIHARPLAGNASR